MHKALILLFFSVIFLHNSDGQGLKQTRILTNRDGFPSVPIRCFEKDYNGILWVGTLEGLCKYDGNELTVFKQSYIDSASLSNNRIFSIVSAADSNLYVGTRWGLNKISNNGMHTITRVKGALSESNVFSLFEDSRKTLWAITSDSCRIFYKQNNTQDFVEIEGLDFHRTGVTKASIVDDNLFIFVDKRIHVFKISYSLNPEIQLSLQNSMESNFFATMLFPDSSGRLWVGSNGVLYYSDAPYASLTQCNKEYELPNVYVTCASEVNNVVYFGTVSDGLLRFDIRQNKFTQHPIVDAHTSLRVSKSIWSIYAAVNGNIWLGVRREGVSLVSFRQGIKEIPVVSDQNELIYGKTINMIAKSKKGSIWLGTDESGLFSYDSTSNTCIKDISSRYLVDLYSIPKSLSFYEDSKQNRWYSFYNNGIRIVDKNEKVRTITSETKPHNLSIDNVWTITEDSLGNIWIGTHGAGLNMISSKNDSMYHFKNNIDLGQYLPPKFITYSYTDTKGDLWFGSYGSGLVTVNMVDTSFVAYKPDSLNDNWFIFQIDEKNEDTLLLATSRGLYYFDKATKKIDRCVSGNNLLNTEINAFCIDKDTIWVAVDAGLLKCNWHYDIVGSYLEFSSENDMVIGKNGLVKVDNSTLLLGTSRGMYQFKPAMQNLAVASPSLKLLSFEVHKPHAHKLTLPTDAVTLGYDENTFQISFSVIDYNRNKSFRYYYRIRNKDTSWVKINNQRSLLFSDLSPGTYNVEVKAVHDKNSEIQSSIALSVIVLPPFYKTLWFQLLSVLLVVAIVVTIFRYRLHYLTQQKKKLEHTVVQRTKLINEQKEELEIQSEMLKDNNSILSDQNEELITTNEELRRSNDTKDRLFSIIAHDLRNPFSTIIGSFDVLERKDNANKDKFYSIIKTSALGAYSILENLLQWYKAQSIDTVADVTELNLFDIVHKAVELYRVDINLKKQKVLLKESSNVNVLSDRNMLETIIRNVINNAVKFTPNEGEIQIDCDVIESRVHLSIKDSGCGMSPEQSRDLFSANNGQFIGENDGFTGTGLGLTISKEFADKCDINFVANSERGVGTNIVVDIPFGSTNAEERDEIEYSESYSEENDTTETEEIDITFLNQKIILLVDDKSQHREIIKNYLPSTVIVQEANNGAEAVEVLRKISPSVIISDIEMPQMNGVELCQYVKSSTKYKQMPVILITGKHNDDLLLDSIKAGADRYIPKPVSSSVLLFTLCNIFKYDKYLKNSLHISETITIEKNDVQPANEQFVQQVVQYINDNMAEPTLTVDSVSKHFNLSRTQFYRKFKAITNVTPVHIIQKIRLEEAKRLLQTGRYSITQVAYDTGFGNPRYFSKCFSNEYGITPKQWVLGKNSTEA